MLCIIHNFLCSIMSLMGIQPNLLKRPTDLQCLHLKLLWHNIVEFYPSQLRLLKKEKAPSGATKCNESYDYVVHFL